MEFDRINQTSNGKFEKARDLSLLIYKKVYGLGVLACTQNKCNASKLRCGSYINHIMKGYYCS